MQMSMPLLKIPNGETEVVIGEGNISSYKVQQIDVDGSGTGTSENGYTIRDVRRRNKTKITVKFDGLTLEEFMGIRAAIDSEKFNLTYFDGTYKTISVYAGDRNFELIKANGEQDSRWRLDTSFIEY